MALGNYKVRFYREAEDGTVTLVSTSAGVALGSGTVTATDSGATRGVKYRYYAIFIFDDGTNTFTLSPCRSIIVQIPGTVSASDPTNLRATSILMTSIQFTWLVNSAVGSVFFDWKAVGTGDPNTSAFWSSGVTTVTKSAGSQAHTLSGLTANTKYAVRIRVSDAGTTASNVVIATTAYDPSLGYSL